ncbi:hypothetical protein Leryth_000973 [Lithospermum erythrorhizon]|nr:hypothetical protein Leryth_000973 [Lithospermum erythrorhizon]
MEKKIESSIFNSNQDVGGSNDIVEAKVRLASHELFLHSRKISGDSSIIKLGTIDQDEAQTEWVIRPYMNTARKRQFLGEYMEYYL